MSCCHNINIDEAKDLRHRFLFSLFFFIPMVLFSMGPMLLGLHHSFPLLELVFVLPLLFWAGLPIWKKAIDSFQKKSLNMFSLIAVGVGTTFIYSCINLFFVSGSSDFYFESAGMMMVLVLLGQFLEAIGTKKTNAALQELLASVPQKVTLVLQDEEKEVLLDQLQVGDIIRIHPGEKIPVDGKIISGFSSVNEAMLTGESFPIEKTNSSVVVSGTLNLQGSFLMKVEKVGSETTLAQIINLVKKAQQSDTPIQHLVDRISAIFVPLIFAVAMLTFVIWMFLHSGWGFAVTRAVSVLMIACPCVLGLATPMAITVGIAQGARRGILIRNSKVLQALASCQMMIFDKTGTLTDGEFEITSLKTFSNTSQDKWLSLLAAAEKGSEHPLAKAFLKEVLKKQISFPAASSFQAISGGGIVAEVEGINVIAGSKKFLQRYNIDTSTLILNDVSTIAVALDKKLTGAVFFKDHIREEAKQVLIGLHNQGLEIAMLTGDHDAAASLVAAELGIKKWKAELSPQQKVTQVQQWKEKNLTLAMIGDGINDAAALAVADASIAMYQGTNLAKENAGIVLMHPSLIGVLEAVSLSRAIMKIIRENLFFAFIYNLLGVPLAAGILYSYFGITLNPMFATAAMSLSSLSVIANSLRLRKRKF